MKFDLLVYTSIFALMVGMPGSLLGMEPDKEIPTSPKTVSSAQSSAEDWRAPFFQQKYCLSGPSLNLEALKEEIITISSNHTKLPEDQEHLLRIDRIKSLLNDDSGKEDETLHEFLYRVYSGTIMKTSPFNDPQKATEILERSYTQEENWSFWAKASLAPKGELTRDHYLAANRGHKEAIAYVKANTPYKPQIARDFCNQLKKTKQKSQHITEFEEKWQRIGYAKPFLDVLKRIKTPILDRIRFLKAAADLGDLNSQVGIVNGEFPLNNKGRTFPYLVKAAKQGDTDSMYNLGVLYHQQNKLEEAEIWYRKAENLGEKEAMTGLGALLQDQNKLEEAETWFRKAAALGDVYAMSNLGVLKYKQNKLEEAETWFRKAAALGDVYAMSNLGVLYHQQNKLEEAETCFREAANLGDAFSMTNLGGLLQDQNKLEEAETWYRKAAALGDVNAIYNLGVLYHQQNKLEEAETWYRKAAALGDVYAIYNLGVLYHQQNKLEEAETWFRKAVLKGFVPSMVQLGRLHLDRGESVEATFWFEKAAALGNQDAQKLLEVSQKSVQPLALRNDEGQLNVDNDFDSELNEIFEKIENPELQEISSMQMLEQKSPISETPESDATSSSSEDELEEGPMPAPEVTVIPDAAPDVQPQVINNPKSRREQARMLGLELRHIAEEVQKPNRRLTKPSQGIANAILSGESDHITQEDLKSLFKDPYFAGQAIVEKTKSGFTVLSHHREKKLHLNAGAHRKHGQEKYTDHIHPNTLKGIKEILNTFDVEKK